MYWMIVPRIHGEGEPVTTRQADFHSECMRSLTEASPLIDPGLSDIYFYQTHFCGEETAGIPLELPQRASDKSRLLQIDQFGRMDKVHARIRYSWRFMCRFRSAASSILSILNCLWPTWPPGERKQMFLFVFPCGIGYVH